MSLSQESELLQKFNVDEILNCMHCGFCLPACPTFQQTGLETYSPRGRIGLMKGVIQGQIQIDSEFEKNMYACLGCRACETACPAGVQYGQLIESAREVIEDDKKGRGVRSFRRRMVFKGFFNHPKRIKVVGKILWALQASGLQKLADKTGLIKILPREMAEMQSAVNKVASPSLRRARWTDSTKDDSERKKQTESSIISEKSAKIPTAQSPRKRVGIFTGCIMDVMFYETNQAMGKLLAAGGFDIVWVPDEACCGALHAHSGEKNDAIGLAKRNIIAFEAADVDYIVNGAGGCGAALKEYDHWLKNDVEFSERAKKFVSKNRDISELLAENSLLDFKKPIYARVTYQDSCHLAHGQAVRRQPREMIRRIPGVEYVELEDADTCCGSAGIYNITNWDMSMQVLDTKMSRVERTDAQIIVTSNPGCLLQIKKGIQRAGLEHRMQAMHIVDLLARAL